MRAFVAFFTLMLVNLSAVESVSAQSVQVLEDGSTIALASPVNSTRVFALAQNEERATASISEPIVQVPVRDARGVELSGLRLGAASLSNNMQQVIIYYRENKEVFAAIREGARGVLIEGVLPLRSIIIASPKKEIRSGRYYISSASQLEVWTDGQITTAIDNPDVQTGADLMQILADGIERLTALEAKG